MCIISIILKSNDDLQEVIIQTSIYIYKQDLLNLIYEIKNHQQEPVMNIVQVGAPNYIISTLNHSVSTPLRQIDLNLLQSKVFRRVYSEKRAIYFRKLPEIVDNLLPNLKQSYQINKTLQQLKRTDIAVVPIELKNLGKEFVLALLGPLSEDQKKLIKEVTLVLKQHYEPKFSHFS